MKTRANSGLVILAVLGLLALCGPARAVESGEQIQGIISHWRFDESQGIIAYDSAGNNDGTLINSPTWATGQINGALSFDGINDYVDVGDPVDGSLDFGADDSFSISAWVKTNKDSPIVSKRRCTGLGGYFVEGYHLSVFQGKLFWNIEDISSNGPHMYGTAVVADDQWHHVAAVRDTIEDKLYIYVDGSADATPVTDNTTATLATSRSFHIGHGDSTVPPGHTYYEGKIDDVRVYDRALSPEEIRQLYLTGFLHNVVGLEIIGPDEVAENFSASYKAIALYDNNSTRDVTGLVSWAVEPNMYATIDESGMLATTDIKTFRNVALLAQCTYGDVTIQADKVITIFPICPIGTALSFDGVNDYVDCGNFTELDGAKAFTVAFWIKADELPFSTHDGIVARGNRSQRTPWIWGHRHASYISMEFETVTGVGFDGGISTPNLTEGKWNHIVMTWNGTTVTAYLDGIERTTDSTVGDTLADTDASLKIGHITNYGYFNGTIDEVAIYNRALSPEEIRATMHTRLNGDEPGLVGYWDFDEGEGQIVYDLSGNGNDGQLGSTPNPDASDPAWVDSDAPIGICSLYQIATMATERAVGRKLAMLEELLAALAQEWTAYEALEELLESGDYGDLNKGDIVTAKQKIHSAIQHQEQAIDALEKSIEKLQDALNALGYESEPTPPPPPPGQASNPNPADGATGVGRNTDLSWTAGSNTVSHNVYFGTTGPGTFRGNQTATTFDPGSIDTYTTYYWRIDEVNPGGTTTSTVWSFRTGNGGPPPM